MAFGLKELPNTILPLGHEQLLSIMQPITKMHPLHSYKEAISQLKNPSPAVKIVSLSFSVLQKSKWKCNVIYMIPVHIQHLCHILNKPSIHYTGTSDQVHVFAGRKHVTERYERYPELYPTLKLMSRI